jgi:hypothetical protein
MTVTEDFQKIGLREEIKDMKERDNLKDISNHLQPSK